MNPLVHNSARTEYAPTDFDADAFRAESARLDAIEAESGLSAVAAELVGIPRETYQSLGPSFTPKSD